MLFALPGCNNSDLTTLSTIPSLSILILWPSPWILDPSSPIPFSSLPHPRGFILLSLLIRLLLLPSLSRIRHPRTPLPQTTVLISLFLSFCGYPVSCLQNTKSQSKPSRCLFRSDCLAGSSCHLSARHLHSRLSTAIDILLLLLLVFFFFPSCFFHIILTASLIHT